MKITVYTTNECQFSRAEKEYLTSKGLMFEEKNLETNKEYLTEMLAVSNNFAGTPVTKIEKDDGTIAVLKGFTKEEFEQTLNPGAAVTAAVSAAPTTVPTATPPVTAFAGQDISQSPTPPAPTPPSPTPPVPTPPIPSPTPPMPEPTPSPVVEPPTANPVVEPPKIEMPVVPTTQASPVSPTAVSAQDPHLTSILNDLQSMASKPEAAATPAAAPQQPQSTQPTATPSTPSIPNPNF